MTLTGWNALAQAGTIVDHADLEHSGASAALDADRSALLAGRDRVLERVLDERLQQQARHQRIERRAINRVLEPQALAEAQALRAEVQIESLDLLAQRDLLHRILIERVAQEFRQPRDRMVGGAVLVVENQRGDR